MLNRKKFISVLVVIAFLIFLVLTAEVTGLFRSDEEISIDVASGSSFDSIADQLEEKGVIGSKTLFKLYFKFFGDTYYMGTHTFTSKGYSDITKQLETVVKSRGIIVTITEGMEQREIANLLEEKGLVTAEEFNQVAKIDNFDYWFLKGIKKRNMELEGYLFPDTYEFSYDESAESIIKKMLDNFDQKFDQEMKKRAEKSGLSVDEIVIMASIVEREAAAKKELGLVAGVFYNRLKPNVESAGYLQSCATVQYILEERKLVLSLADTQIKSPYNTYLNKGLPVGPIASPGLECIKAALYPEDTSYLYFVADGNGKHYFAETLSGHNENMRKAGLL